MEYWHTLKMSKFWFTISISAALMIFLVIFLAGCSYNSDRQVRRVPIEMREILALDLTFTPAKIAYSNIDNSIYIMEQGSNLIRIYRDGVIVNTVGGLGFSESNFNRLSDITVSPHGRLLALDSFLREIKKFDSNGMWLGNYPIRSLNEPLLLDISQDGMVFIYDRTSNEIVIFDELIEEVVYRFGKFMFQEPVQLISTFTYIAVYDRIADRSFFFDNYGKFIEDIPGYWQIDRYNNRYRLVSNKISFPDADVDFLLFHKPWRSFYVKGTMNYLIAERSIKISEIMYERN